LFACLSQSVFYLADRLVKLLARVAVFFGSGCLLKLGELLLSRGVLLAQCIKLALKSLRIGCFRLAVFQLRDFFSKVIKFLPGTFAIRLSIGAGICLRISPEFFGFFPYCLGGFFGLLADGFSRILDCLANFFRAVLYLLPRRFLGHGREFSNRQ